MIVVLLAHQGRAHARRDHLDHADADVGTDELDAQALGERVQRGLGRAAFGGIGNGTNAGAEVTFTTAASSLLTSSGRKAYVIRIVPSRLTVT
ncbi:hypothetical protein [Streptomyces sp. 303MFCol5.2]|uniref:hypothetical protein n=1 Tax=Streptomyces sp. 303MFCol5.2 TaxID=1172181 RepID=UPI0003638C84|nr:hypothetical protein [Streptomyces sp. 303MFCol5.2]